MGDRQLREMFKTYPLVFLGEDNFDPKKRVFNDDDLRPQPMIKKSKKVS